MALRGVNADFSSIDFKGTTCIISKALAQESVFANKSLQTKPDVREKVNIDEYIKILVKDNGFKKIKQPGGDAGTAFYSSDKWIMAVDKKYDGSVEISFIDQTTKGHNKVEKYDKEGHLTQSSDILGNYEFRTEYLPDGSKTKVTLYNGKLVE